MAFVNPIISGLADERGYTRVISRTPVSEIIDARTVADYCRIEDGYDLDEIRSMIIAAGNYCEDFMGRYITESTVSQYVEGFKSHVPNAYKREIRLVYPANSIDSVKATDASGSEVDVTYTFNPNKNVLVLDYNLALRYHDFYITYNTGYPKGLAPELIPMAIKLLVNTMFESRSEDIYGISVSKSSMTVDRLLQTLKIQFSG